MFAFVIWDSETRTVFGARDPFGIKPLFDPLADGEIVFSSEKKALSSCSAAARPPAASTPPPCSTT